MYGRRYAGLLVGLITLAGCEMMMQPPEEDPLYLRQADIRQSVRPRLSVR